MGRPPCCDKIGVKKGPWTPEEDIALVTYVQDHGPGNWKAVPITTGLKRCSKSCRLRWTNYLRPGIKRGSFTDQEEKMIIQLQALLGNKWAAISSYLPERTDNDIKNYWNTHLKKKLKKSSTDDQSRICCYKPDGFSSKSRGQWERRLQADISTAKQALNDALSFHSTPEESPAADTEPVQAISYASSTGNIARLLKRWAKAAPMSEESSSSSKCCSSNQNSSNVKSSCSDQDIGSKSGVDLSEPCRESLFGFEAFEYSTCDEFSTSPGSLGKIKSEHIDIALPPLSMIENWLLDDHQGKDYLIDSLNF